MSTTPWTKGPNSDGSWISEEDRTRVDRHNSKLLRSDDDKRIWYTTPSGRHLTPGQWSGNPWTAPILLLLLNPGYSDSRRLDEAHADDAFRWRLEAAARGQWDAEYPNPMLHPTGRQLEPWYATIAFPVLHQHLSSSGVEAEEAWKRLSQRVAVLELSPWASRKWSTAAIGSTTKLSIRLAQEAMDDPSRIVLLGRGEDDWRSAGLLDADLLPKSLGIRVNQSRITRANFPRVWDKLLQKLD